MLKIRLDEQANFEVVVVVKLESAGSNKCCKLISKYNVICRGNTLKALEAESGTKIIIR